MKPSITEESLVLFEDITEGAANLPANVLMRVRARAHVAGKVTANGNLYRPELFAREAERLSEELTNGGILMYPRHPKVEKDAQGNIVVESMSPADAVGAWRKIEMLPNQDGTSDVMIEADLADNTRGRDIAALVRMRVKVPISSRARGTADRITLTAKHPLANSNKEWVGKEVNNINDDFSLGTFDFVSQAASGGSRTISFREEAKEEGEMDLTKLTEEEWKKIVEHEKIKELIKAGCEKTAEDVRSELSKEFEEKIQTRADEKIAEFIASEEFKKMIEKDQTEATAKCPGCEAAVPKGVKFCPECGRNMQSGAGKKEDVEDPNAALLAKIEELDKKLGEKDERIAKLEDENKKKTEKVKVEEHITTALLGKPIAIIERVKKDLATRVLTEENMEETVKTSIELIEETYKTAGIDPSTLPAGGAQVKPLDEGEKDKKDELTEQQKEQQKRMKPML